MLVLAALGVDPQFGWAKKSGEGVTRFVNEPAVADAVSNSAIHIRKGVPLPAAAPASAASRVRNAHSASQSAKVTQLHQERGPNNVMGREMNRVKDYVKTGHRGEKDHGNGRANKGGRNQEPARRGGNDRSRSLSPAKLHRRSEPAKNDQSRDKPEQGVFVKGPAHARHTRVADGGYQKSSLKQKHAPALHLNRGREGKPAGEYDLETKTYGVPAGSLEGQQQQAAPAAAVPAAAAGLLGEEQLKSLGALQRAAGEKMRLLGETQAPQQQQQGKQQGTQQEAPPAAADQKLEAQKQETPQNVVAAELQPPGGAAALVRPEPAAAAGEWKPPAGGKPAAGYNLDTRTFTTPDGKAAAAPAGEKAAPAAAAAAAAAAPAFGEHEHGAVFQKVEEKLKAEGAKEMNTTQVSRPCPPSPSPNQP